MRLGVARLTAAARAMATSAPAVLRVGGALRERRRFTEEDVAAYAEVSGDRNPVHLDAAFAREVAGFERGRVVHGMLVASLFPSLIATHFPGAVYASQSLKFALPVYIGDEVLAEVQAINIKESKKTYIVRFTTQCFTNGVSLAIDGEAMTVLPTLELTRCKIPMKIGNPSKPMEAQSTSLHGLLIDINSLISQDSVTSSTGRILPKANPETGNRLFGPYTCKGNIQVVSIIQVERPKQYDTTDPKIV